MGEPSRHAGRAATVIPAWALLEAVLATAAGAALVRLSHQIGGWWAVLGPAVWVYLPLAILLAARRPLGSAGFALAPWLRGWKWLLGSAAVVLLPFAAVVAGYRAYSGKPVGFAPEWRLAAEILFLVAIPEEIFFRGYLQERLRSGTRGLGTSGTAIAILLTAALFALAHLAVEPGWLRAAVFFPGLILGWLREKSRSLLAPAGFHWLADFLWISFGLG